METIALFEEKVPLTPGDFSNDTIHINGILRRKLAAKLEGHCSLHGWVKPDSVRILGRSMGYIEKGRFTGDVVFHVQAEGNVTNPSSGSIVVGQAVRKNKGGMFVNYKDAITIFVPRDLHIGNEEYDSIQIGESVRVEIKKSRFQVNDESITSIGIFLGRAEAGSEVEEQPVPVAAAAPGPVPVPAEKAEEAQEEAEEGQPPPAFAAEAAGEEEETEEIEEKPPVPPTPEPSP